MVAAAEGFRTPAGIYRIPVDHDVVVAGRLTKGEDSNRWMCITKDSTGVADEGFRAAWSIGSVREYVLVDSIDDRVREVRFVVRVR